MSGSPLDILVRRHSSEPVFSLRQIRKDPADIDAFLYAIQGDLELIRRETARLPTRKEVWLAIALGMIGGAGLVELLALAFR